MTENVMPELGDKVKLVRSSNTRNTQGGLPDYMARCIGRCFIVDYVWNFGSASSPRWGVKVRGSSYNWDFKDFEVVKKGFSKPLIPPKEPTWLDRDWKNLCLGKQGRSEFEYILWSTKFEPREDIPWEEMLSKFEVVTSKYNENWQRKKVHYSHNRSCFQGLLPSISTYSRSVGKTPDRLLYKCGFHNTKFKCSGGSRYVLSEDEIREYMLLCLQHKLLPHYTDVERFLKSGEMIIRLNKHTPNKVYLYFVTARYVNEAPGLVRLALYFRHSGIKNWYVALILAHGKLDDYTTNRSLLSFNQLKTRFRTNVDEYGWSYDCFQIAHPVELFAWAKRLEQVARTRAGDKPINSKVYWKLHDFIGSLYIYQPRIPKGIKLETYTDLKLL